MKKEKFKKIFHVDEKVVNPKDVTSSSPIFGKADSNQPKETFKEAIERSKTIIGRPKVYDLNGNLLADEENLVVLIGREYIAQLIAGDRGDNPLDFTKYRVNYFGVGDGGTNGCLPPTANGPFDDDTDLVNRVKIKDNATINPEPDYIDNGKLKKIRLDGEVKVIEEEHTINVDQGGEVLVYAYTAIKFTLYLQVDEPENKPFRFNEAGLFAVKYEYDPDYNQDVPVEDEYILFARFTTLDKYLETNDGIMIEWYILV
jgi:hypothetical protein